MTADNVDRALVSDRAFMEEWCYVCGKYSKEYYRNLSDDELEKMYESLTEDISRQQQG